MHNLYVEIAGEKYPVIPVNLSARLYQLSTMDGKKSGDATVRCAVSSTRWFRKDAEGKFIHDPRIKSTGGAS